MAEFSINHRVAPGLSLPDFFRLAASLDLATVEIRNDLPGVGIADGTAAASVRAEADRHRLSIISINALYPFNIWTDARAEQAAALIGYAAASGAEGIVMCPLNDADHKPSDADRLAALRDALLELAPLLRGAGVTGLIEPLGFAECSLRLKREAVEAIDAVGGGDVFRLVHDTFHHHVAGETEIFPERTGLVHISGVVDPVATERMRDPHRVLVDEADRIGNLSQIRALMAGGYQGPLSFEPFADSVSASPDIASALRASMRLIRDTLSSSQVDGPLGQWL